MKNIYILISLFLSLTAFGQTAQLKGNNNFSGVNTMTNQANTFSGTFTGNGTALMLSGTNIAAATGITNILRVQIQTNNSAYIPGIGYTNFTSSTSLGINEVVNLYPFLPPFTNNPFYSGLRIELGAGDFPFSSEINLGTNNISIAGQSQWTTILRWVGSTNHYHLIYNNNIQPSAGHLELHDFSVVVRTNFQCNIFDVTNDIMNMADMQIVGPSKINNGTWNYVVGNTLTNTELPGLVGMMLASGAAGGNIHSIKRVTFSGNAVGLYISDANWVDIDDCSFFVSSCYNNNNSFSNSWPIGDPRHAGAAIVNNAPVGLTKVQNSHFLQCRAKIATTGGAPTQDSDNQNESCLLEDLCAGNAYMLFNNKQSAPIVSPCYGLDSNFNTNGPCPIFIAEYYGPNPSGSTTTSYNLADGSNNVAYSFGVPDMIGGNDAGFLDYTNLVWVSGRFSFKNIPQVVGNPIIQQTNVLLSTATTFTWQFGRAYSDTNYSVSAQGAAAALVSPSIGAKTTSSVVINFNAFTGQLDLMATHQ